jgi:hypothetical protein
MQSLATNLRTILDPPASSSSSSTAASAVAAMQHDGSVKPRKQPRLLSTLAQPAPGATDRAWPLPAGGRFPAGRFRVTGEDPRRGVIDSADDDDDDDDDHPDNVQHALQQHGAEATPGAPLRHHRAVDFAPVYAEVYARGSAPAAGVDGTATLQQRSAPPPSVAAPVVQPLAPVQGQPTRGGAGVATPSPTAMAPRALTPWQQCEQKLAIVIDGDSTGQLKGAPLRDAVHVTRALLLQYRFPPENVYVLTATQPEDFRLRLAASTAGDAPGTHQDDAAHGGGSGGDTVALLRASSRRVHVNGTSSDSVRHTVRGVVQRVSEFAQRSFLWFHYSGHGILLRPPDGASSASSALQVGADAYVTDAELYALLVAPLPRRARLFALIDCCNSGNALNLPFGYDARQRQWQAGVTAATFHGDMPQAEVTAIGACQATEVDEQVNGPLLGHGGALTVAFLESPALMAALDDPVSIVDGVTPKFRKLAQRPQLQAGAPVLPCSTP